jgi:multiple sugar transport system permease protein
MNASATIASRALKWAAFSAVTINGFAPLAWIFITSIKTEHELVRRPITWWPDKPTLANYVKAFSEQPLLRFVGNSVAVSTLSSALALVVSASAAYALARLPVPRRGLWLTLLIAVAMCPPASLLAPLFETLRALGLLNTWGALVLPNAVGSMPVCTLVLVAFFRALPLELEEAALIDGCSRLRAIRSVTLPLAWPGLATAALLAFVNAWDEFLFALTFNAAPGARTLPVGILYYQGEYTFPWPVISAALVVGILPLALLIVAFQERVVGGLTAGGVKG